MTHDLGGWLAEAMVVSVFALIELFFAICSRHQKTRDTGLPDGEDCIPLRSLILTQCRSVTDKRTDGFAVARTALAKLALRAL